MEFGSARPAARAEGLTEWTYASNEFCWGDELVTYFQLKCPLYHRVSTHFGSLVGREKVQLVASN